MDKWYKDKKWVITTSIAILAVIVAAYYAWQNYALQSQLFEASLPYIITQGLQTPSNSSNLAFPFYVMNPSNQEYSINFSQSTCEFSTNLIYPTPIQRTNSTQIVTSPIYNVEVSPNFHAQTSPLFSKNITSFQCSGFSVNRTTTNMNTSMNVCIKIIGISNKICGSIPITITKS